MTKSMKKKTRRARGTIEIKNIARKSPIGNYWVKCDVYDLETGEHINADMNTWNHKRKIPIHDSEKRLNPLKYEGKTIEGVIEFEDRWNAGKLYYEALKIIFERVVEGNVITPFNPFIRNKFFKEKLEPAEPVRVWSILDATARPITYLYGELVVLDIETGEYVPADLEVTHKASDSKTFYAQFTPSEYVTSWCEDVYENEGTKVAWSKTLNWWIPIVESECFIPFEEVAPSRPKRKLSNDPNQKPTTQIKRLSDL